MAETKKPTEEKAKKPAAPKAEKPAVKTEKPATAKAEKPAAVAKAAPAKTAKPAVDTKPVEAKKPATAKAEAVKATAKTEAAKPAAEKPAKTDKNNTQKQLKVTLIKSTNGCLKKQKATIEALGLRKIRQEKILPDNACTRGMIFVVSHLIKVEEI